MVHNVQKTLILETDVPETINEMIVAVKTRGQCGVLAAPAS